jgi:hypothetical protein
VDLDGLEVVGAAGQGSCMGVPSAPQQVQHQQRLLHLGEAQQQQRQSQEEGRRLQALNDRQPEQQQQGGQSFGSQLAALGSASTAAELSVRLGSTAAAAAGPSMALRSDVLELLASLQDRVLELEAKLSKDR